MRPINYNLMLAAQGEDLGRVEALLKAGADASVRTWAMEEGPLFRAAESGTGEICTALVKAGADVNAVDIDGETPLHWAVRWGNLDAVEALLEMGASLTAGASSARVAAYKAVVRAHKAQVLVESKRYEHLRGTRIARRDMKRQLAEGCRRAEILRLLSIAAPAPAPALP